MSVFWWAFAVVEATTVLSAAWVLVKIVRDWERAPYQHAADCSWAIGESDECSCGLDEETIARMANE